MTNRKLTIGNSIITTFVYGDSRCEVSGYRSPCIPIPNERLLQITASQSKSIDKPRDISASAVLKFPGGLEVQQPPVHVYRLSLLNENMLISIPVQNSKHFEIWPLPHFF